MTVALEGILPIGTMVLTAVAAIWSLVAARRARREIERNVSRRQVMLERLMVPRKGTRELDIRIMTKDGRHYSIEVSHPGHSMRRTMSKDDVERIAEILARTGGSAS